MNAISTTMPSTPRKMQAAPLMLVSMLILILVWGVLLIGLGDIVGELSKVSASVRNFARDGDANMLMAMALVGSVICTTATSLLLSRSPSVFITIWLFTLSFAEAEVPILAYLSLAGRYSMMVSLIAAGVVGLLNRRSLDQLQCVALAILAITLLQGFINPVDINAQLSLPMQLAIFIGVFFGLYPLARQPHVFDSLLTLLAISGVLITAINLASFVAGGEVFLGGRFRSWYPLPTNFSNNFVLCAIPMFWMMLSGRQPMLRLLYTTGSIAAIAMLVLAGTRNALLVVALTTLQFCYLWQRRYFIYVATGLVLLALAATAFQFGLTDIAATGSRLNIDQKETRFFVWERALAYIQMKPITGYGLSADLASLDHRLPIWEQFNAHNAFLGLWLRLGLIGALLYLYIYWRALRQGFSVALKVRRSVLRSPLLVVFLCLLLDLLVAGLFEENLTSRASIHQALWALAVVIVCGQTALIRQQTKLRRGTTAAANDATATPSSALPKRHH